MLVLSWNCQGVGRPLTVSNLRELCAVHRPNIVFLMETKNSEEKLESIRRLTSFDGYFYVNPNGRSGGLALWLNNNTSVQVINGNKNLILAEVCCPSPSSSFRACFVYGPHTREDRARVWRRIINQAISCSGPFLLIGDFNLIGGISDKQGGSVNVSRRIDEFQEFMYSSELIDIPFNGMAYTWDNKRNGGENVRERIDRAMGNAALFEAFPNQSLSHLPLIGSDHSPLIYKTCSSQKKRKKSFKFESMWTIEESCEEAIRNSWCTFQQNDHMKNLKNQLASCAVALRSWSRSHFGNNKKIISELTAELTRLQSLPPTIEIGSQQRVILSKLEETWLREEMFWHQRSRVNWLKYGDKNSRFFHLSTIHRSQCNKIHMLKNDQGVWVDNSDDLNHLILDHFKAIYSSSGDRNFDGILDMITPVVSSSMSAHLESQVSQAEIDRAVKSLGGLKAPGEDGFPGIFFQKYWHIVGELVSKAIMQFFNNGTMLPSLNKTLVVLIPKVPAPETIGQFRPISLCNFVYRVISKVMVKIIYH